MKINDKHLKAIARAQHFVRSGITSSMQPRHRQQIENDIYLLDQVHTFCLQQIIEPGLPLSAGLIVDSPRDNEHGRTDSKTPD